MENHIYKQSFIMFLGVHVAFFILCFFVLVISLTINLFLFAMLLVICFGLFGHLLSKQKTIIIEKDNLLISAPSYSKRIPWSEIASMSSPSYLVFGYVIQLKNGERYTLPFYQNWKEFEKDIQSRAGLDVRVESWYPGMGWPKGRMWAKPHEKDLFIGIYDGWLYLKPEHFFTRASIKYILFMLAIVVAWIFFALILKQYY